MSGMLNAIIQTILKLNVSMTTVSIISGEPVSKKVFPRTIRKFLVGAILGMLETRRQQGGHFGSNPQSL